MRNVLASLSALVLACSPVDSVPSNLEVFTNFENISPNTQVGETFGVGISPVRAEFSGDAFAGVVGVRELYSSGFRAWMINPGGTGRIAFETNAAEVEFQARTRSTANGPTVITAFDDTDQVVDSVTLTASDGFQLVTFTGDIDRLEVVNEATGAGQMSSIDDFGFSIVADQDVPDDGDGQPGAFTRLEDPIDETISKGSISIELAAIAEGLTSPNSLTHARDGTNRLFITDQAGQIRLIQNGQLMATPFLDVSENLVTLGVFGTQDPQSDFDERGLLGLAFHPGFADTGSGGFGKFYTYTSEPITGAADFTLNIPADRSMDHQSVVREWTVDDITSEVYSGTSREILRIDQPQFNHNGGTVMFGPDRLLYISLGDGGSADDQDGQDFFGLPTVGHGAAGNGQDVTTAHGSVLRIDPTADTKDSANGQYGIPADNPLVGLDAVLEIYAYGFRNPFRFSFDVDPASGSLTGDATGRLILGDVGQEDVEEINIVDAGGNYGWSLKEGSFRFVPDGRTGSDDTTGFVSDDLTGLPENLVDPVAQYDQNLGDTGLAEGIAVIGGFVYRGSAIPELVGKYVFGDFAQAFDGTDPTGRLFHADLASGRIEEFVVGEDDRDLGVFVTGIGQDAEGEIYVLGGTNFGPFGNQGRVQKIVPLTLSP